MKIKTSDLTGAALDWAVAAAEGYNYSISRAGFVIVARRKRFQPSLNWAQGGPILEQERISVHDEGTHWWAHRINQAGNRGPTALIAAVRCFVASKFGNEVEIPDELKSSL